MSKTSFELEITAETIEGVRSIVEEQVGSFLGITAEMVQSLVDFEYKVKSGEGKKIFKVTVYGAVKRNVPGLTK